MASPNNRHSGGPSRLPTRRTHPAKPRLVQWWKRFRKLILSVGGLAAALTAVLTLVLTVLPKHAQEKVAHFVSVQALSQVPLGQYPQRSAVFKLQSAGHSQKHGPTLVVAVDGPSSPQSIPGDAATTSPPTSSATASTPTETGSPSGTVSPSATGLTAPGRASPARRFTLRDGLTERDRFTLRDGLTERDKFTLRDGLTGARGRVARSSGMSPHEFVAHAKKRCQSRPKVGSGITSQSLWRSLHRVYAYAVYRPEWRGNTGSCLCRQECWDV